MKCNVATKSTVVLTKEETKVKKICEFFDCRKICTYEDFVMALECGEYVIGGTLVPFNPQYVFHYDEGRFDVFEVEPSMKIHPRMKVKRLRTTISKHTVERCLEEESVPECDSYFVSYRNNLLDYSDIPPIDHIALDKMWAALMQYENNN